MPEIRSPVTAGSKLNDDYMESEYVPKNLDWSEEVEDHIASWD